MFCFILFGLYVGYLVFCYLFLAPSSFFSLHVSHYLRRVLNLSALISSSPSCKHSLICSLQPHSSSARVMMMVWSALRNVISLACRSAGVPQRKAWAPGPGIHYRTPLNNRWQTSASLELVSVCVCGGIGAACGKRVDLLESCAAAASFSMAQRPAEHVNVHHLL